MATTTPERTTEPAAHAAPGGTAELTGAVIVALLGVAMTTSGVFGHYPMLVAPGSILALFGGGWLGNALARRDVRLFPVPTVSEGQPE